jgi:malate dehydrogenase
MDGKELDALIEEARFAGDTILSMAQRSTSYYAPSAATAALVDAIIRDTHAILPVSVRCDGEYGVHDLCVGVPATVGAGGVQHILQLKLSDTEARAFRGAVAELEEVKKQATRDAA